MSTESYHALLKDLCRVVGLRDVQGLVSSGRLFVGRTEMRLSYDPGVDPEHVVMSVDMGAIAAERAQETLQTMLAADLVYGSLDTGLFGVAARDRARFKVRLPLACLDGQNLADAMVDYADEAQRWRGLLITR